MSEWEECYLSDVGTLARGKSKHRPRWAEHLYGGSYPFIQTGEISAANKYINTYRQSYSEAGLAQSKLWDKGTLCITIAANIAEIAILDFPACFPDSILGFVPDPEKADLDFVFYTLTFFKEKIQNLAIGSVQENINLGTFQNIKFLFPLIEEQKQVAAVLSCLDRKIENLRKQNETLERIAQTLFKHWFVDFEFPNEDGKPYKSSGGAMERSELGEIPVGWRVLTLKEICETIYRYPQFYGMEKSDKGVPVIRGEHLLANGKISNDFSDYWFVSDEFSKGFPRTILKKFDVVLSVRGSVGNYSWVGNQHIGVQISPNTIRLSANSKILHDYLLYPFLKACNFKDRLLQTVSSSAVPAINASEFKTFDFVIPSLSLQKQIAPLFRGIYQKIDASEHQIQTLTKTRNVLLPQLMSGKLRITE